jgi:nicotinate-nucleotide pyrophosphorylase
MAETMVGGGNRHRASLRALAEQLAAALIQAHFAVVGDWPQAVHIVESQLDLSAAAIEQLTQFGY